MKNEKITRLQYLKQRTYAKNCPLGNKVGSPKCLNCQYHKAHTETTAIIKGKECKKYFVFCKNPGNR